MEKIEKIGKTLIVAGIIFLLVTIFLFKAGAISNESFFVLLLGLNLLVLFIGVILLTFSPNYRTSILKIFFGLVLLSVGVGMTISQIEKGNAGVAVYGGIPLPLILISFITAFGGLYLLVKGFIDFFDQ